MATNKNKTPLLRPLRTKSATMYVFPSAQEDIGLNLDSRSSSVELSHFALLNLPQDKFCQVIKDKCEDTEDTTFEAKIAVELQNYVMNYETLLMNQEDYNYQDYQTVSERVFWHWLTKRLGLISFTEVDSTENVIKEDYDRATQGTERIVQCFGQIDCGNSVSGEFGLFNETYINVPTSYGNGPVYFRQTNYTNETNYRLNRHYHITQDGRLEGRASDELFTKKYLEYESPIVDSDDYYDTTESFDEGIEIVKNLNTIQKVLNDEVNADLEGKSKKQRLITITSYDDINVDSNLQFKDSLYDITTEPCEFNFNAILLYYSIIDTDHNIKAPLATNLFGIIFLNSVITVGEGDAASFYIEPTVKKKSYGSFNGDVDNYFGNGFSFRVNIKTMSVYDDKDAVIQDNTTMTSTAATEFSDVIYNLNRAIDIMNTNMNTTMAIQNSYMNILSYYDDQKTVIEDLSTMINSYIKGTRTSVIDTSLVYGNMLRTANTEENTLHFQVFKEITDSSVKVYTDDVAFIDSSGISTLQSFTLSPNDIDTDYILNETDVDDCIEELINDIDVIMYRDQDDEQNVKAVVDCEDKDFQESGTFRHLKKIDANGKVYYDYASLVPYIIKFLQYKFRVKE